jgi:cysteine synthase A
VKHGVLFDRKEAEGTRRRHQVDTVVEGMYAPQRSLSSPADARASGLNRLTANFSRALPVVDDAVRVSDAEAAALARHLVARDGLFLGSSAAANLVACVKLVHARGWVGSGRRVATILWVTCGCVCGGSGADACVQVRLGEPALFEGERRAGLVGAR